MADEIKFEAYYIKVKDLIHYKKAKGGNKRTYYLLGDIEGRDLLKMYNEFLKSNGANYQRKASVKRSFQVLTEQGKFFKDDQARITSGIIESGEFGRGSKIKNIKGKVVHAKKPDHSIDMPFYFLLYVPQGKERAILIIQKTGVHGIYGVLRQHFVEYMRKRFPKYKVEFSTVMSKALAKKILLEGGVKTMIFTKNVRPKDIADNLGDGFSDENLTSISATMNLVVEARGNGFLNVRSKLKKFIKDRSLATLAINELGFKDGEFRVKTRVKYGDSIRTIDLTDTMNLKPYFELDQEEIVWDSKRHPEFDSIDAMGKITLEDVINEENINS